MRAMPSQSVFSSSTLPWASAWSAPAMALPVSSVMMGYSTTVSSVAIYASFLTATHSWPLSFTVMPLVRPSTAFSHSAIFWL